MLVWGKGMGIAEHVCFFMDPVTAAERIRTHITDETSGVIGAREHCRGIREASYERQAEFLLYLTGVFG
jgi:hypothetical protein